MSRLRIRYAKYGKVRFCSHRDMARVVERAIRRAGVPVAYSQGFSPRPKLHFGLALSTGHTSDAEFLDIDLDPDRVGVREPSAVLAALQPCLPTGVTLTAAEVLAPGEPSLQDAVTSTAWRIEVPAERSALAGSVEAMLAAASVEVDIVRKGKQVREDLRPLIVGLEVEPSGADGAVLVAELGTKPRSVRPSELVAALGAPEPLRVHRTHQWIQRDGRRFEPLTDTSVASPHAEVRAS